MKDFVEFLLLYRKDKNIRLFFDIETLQYNQEEAKVKDKPTLYKNVTYSVAVSYYNSMQLKVVTFPNFKHLFDLIINTYSKWKGKPRFEMIAHNTNKYDNHFLRYELLYFYPDMIIKDFWLRNANNEANEFAYKKKDLTKEEKEGCILEKRIKSSNNLDLTFYLNQIEFTVIDNLMKTNTSIKTLGEKLLNLNLIKEEELKTDFDYTKYHRDYDMTDDEAHRYAMKVYENLDEEEMTYIHNDVIILGKSVYHYKDLFNGFDYNKITYTKNILDYYNDNPLTSYQLIKSIGQGKDKEHIKFTDFKFANENFYDYLKPFYRGGLNFYNDIYIGIILKDLFSMDLNSSYPHAMYGYKVPTFLKEYKEYEYDTEIDISIDDDTYSLYRMTKESFDYYFITNIESDVIKKMLVKYYSTNDFININSYTLRMLKKITGLKINKLKVLSWLTFECEYFGSRDKISEMYKVKTEGSSKYKVIYNNPYDIIETDELNTDNFFTPEEVNISKVKLNGLYGIPALRPYFNVFRSAGEILVNFPNGYANNERNIVFSIFVTSVALYNLLEPLSYLTHAEIDKHFIYCDTDSLYLSKDIMHKIPKSMFHKHHLGKWDLEHEHIFNFVVMNHKKYAYEAINKKGKKEITVKAGGIPNNSFKRNMSFKKFVDTQFYDGVEIMVTKFIYNQQKTISAYEAPTKLEYGKPYRKYAVNKEWEQQKKSMFEEIRNDTNGNVDDMLYIESTLGTFSLSDIYPITHENSKKLHLTYFEFYEDKMREKIKNMV